MDQERLDKLYEDIKSKDIDYKMAVVLEVLKSMEKRFIEIESNLKINIEKFRQYDRMFELLEVKAAADERRHKNVVSFFDDLCTENLRYREVYYHVFPDRVLRDMKFYEQLDALQAKNKPEADPQEP